MELLTSEQIERVYAITDALGLHRTWVTVPMAAGATPGEWMMPDGKVLICPPAGPSFETWLSDLRQRLLALDISRAARAEQQDRPPVRVPPEAPPGSGPKRYLPWRP